MRPIPEPLARTLSLVMDAGPTNALVHAHHATARTQAIHSLLTSAPPARDRVLLLTGLAGAGCLVAIYLALYQVGVVTAIWEPFFGDGSRLLLRSSLASSLPVPDAALGAAGYLAELLCVSARYRGPQWLDDAYYLLVGTFAAGSAVLVALQWGYFHAWCTLCLTSALLSFVIAGVVIGEFRARRGQADERES